MPKISLVSSVYNREMFLHKCISSMLSQSYKNIEIVLLNNASKDGSKKIIDDYALKYPALIKAVHLEDNLGAGGGRMAGFNHASGDYVCFVDSDDYLEPSYIENCAKHLAQNPTLPDIAISGFKKVDTNGKVLYVRQYKNPKQALFQSIAPWGKLYKKSYFLKTGLALRNIPFAEDVIFFAEIALSPAQIALCPNVGYCWLQNANSTSSVDFRGFPASTLEQAFNWFCNLLQKYGSKDGLLEYFAFKYVVWYLLHSGRNVGKTRMLKEYALACEKMLKYFPNYKKSPYISFFKPKEERAVVRLAVKGMAILQFLKLDKCFLTFYAQRDFSKLWPKL